MASVISSNVSILASVVAPPSNVYYQYWLNLTDGRLYHYFGDTWVRYNPGLSGEYEGTITKIKVEDGLVTEVEVG